MVEEIFGKECKFKNDVSLQPIYLNMTKLLNRQKWILAT